MAVRLYFAAGLLQGEQRFCKPDKVLMGCSKPKTANNAKCHVISRLLSSFPEILMKGLMALPQSDLSHLQKQQYDSNNPPWCFHIF